MRQETPGDLLRRLRGDAAEEPATTRPGAHARTRQRARERTNEPTRARTYEPTDAPTDALAGERSDARAPEHGDAAAGGLPQVDDILPPYKAAAKERPHVSIADDVLARIEAITDSIKVGTPRRRHYEVTSSLVMDWLLRSALKELDGEP